MPERKFTPEDAENCPGFWLVKCLNRTCQFFAGINASGVTDAKERASLMHANTKTPLCREVGLLAAKIPED